MGAAVPGRETSHPRCASRPPGAPMNGNTPPGDTPAEARVPWPVSTEALREAVKAWLPTAGPDEIEALSLLIHEEVERRMLAFGRQSAEQDIRAFLFAEDGPRGHA